MATLENALISVSDKTGIIALTQSLHDLGVGLYSTGGTAKALRSAGIPVTDVASYTGSPEILGGRVKTLHPRVHGGILGKADDSNHLGDMEKHGIAPIGLVVVNLYPFEKTVSQPDCSIDDAIENIDIGGVALLRSAGKNHAFVTVLVDPNDYRGVVEELRNKGRQVSAETRRRLAVKAFQHTAHYDSVIANYLDRNTPAAENQFPAFLPVRFEKIDTLRYGENMHQQGAFYRELGAGGPSIATATQHHGKAMSFNNVLDANSALELAFEFDEPAAAIIKHVNPCGVAVDRRLVDAFVSARDTDPLSAFGGVIGLNRYVDLDTAKEITSNFVEVIVAPGFYDDALAHLKQKRDLRLLDLGLAHSGTTASTAAWMLGVDMKRVKGGLLLQGFDPTVDGDFENLKVVSQRAPTDDELSSLRFAWRVTKHVRSNAIVYVKGNKTIGIGAGQMSRVDSVQLAAKKALRSLKGTVMASDAFFPFRDGIDEAATVGITAVIQPGGSIRDDEVIQSVDEYGMAMVLTGVRHFRHA